jgi:hypothetical protein
MNSSQNLSTTTRSWGRNYSSYDYKRHRKVYVGQTRIQTDLEPHGMISAPAFFNQPNRYVYCIESEYTNLSQKDLDRREITMIIRRSCWRNADPAGMNLRLGGSRGRHCHESIFKLSKAHTGKRFSAESKAKMSANSGVPARFAKLRQNPEDWSAVQERARANGAKSTSEHQLSSCDKLKQDPERWARWQEQARINGNHLKAREHLINLNKARKGKPLSEATRQKMREARARQLTTSPSPPHGRL